MKGRIAGHCLVGRDHLWETAEGMVCDQSLHRRLTLCGGTSRRAVGGGPRFEPEEKKYFRVPPRAK